MSTTASRAAQSISTDAEMLSGPDQASGSPGAARKSRVPARSASGSSFSDALPKRRRARDETLAFEPTV